MAKLNEKLEETIYKVVSVLATLIIIVSIYNVGNWLGNLLFPPREVVGRLPDVIQTPAIENPSTNALNEPLPEIKRVELLIKPYTPSPNPYSEISYKQEALKLVIDGDFEIVNLKIRGDIIGSGYRFLSLNFGQESGIIRAVRSASNKLNIHETITKGGAFSSENPINIEVDLLHEIKIGTIGQEFDQIGGEKSVTLWNSIGTKPPTVTYLLVAPFTETGAYGGANITSLEIEYACKEGSVCKISRCDNSKKTTQCLLEALGSEAMNTWCKNTSLCH